jgi:outer membrane immunogenic protein
MMRIGLAVVAASVLALGAVTPAARAADLGAPRIPVAAEVVATGFTWTAVYGGLHAGYGFANTSISVPGVFGFSGIGSNGWLVGGKVGADYQFAQRWVAGVLLEGNLQGIDTVIGFGGGNLKLSGDRRWAVRGRLGYLLTPETLLYVTGGFTQGRTTFSVTGLGSASITANGWQVGGGIETRLAGNWFMYAEYIHTFSNSFGQFAPLSVKPTSGTARIGLNYRFGFGGLHPSFAAPVRRNWSGFFAGVQAGYGFSNTTISAPGVFSFRGIGSQGVTGGVLAGYDHQFAGTNIVAGVEADASLSDIKTTINLGGASASIGSDWNVGLRARLGYVMGGSIMPYVSAGYGWTHVKTSGLGGGFSQSLSGFQLGAGVETMLTQNVALRAEYIHQFNGSRDLIPGLLRTRTDNGRARVGITYKFGGEDAAVVARY